MRAWLVAMAFLAAHTVNYAAELPAASVEYSADAVTEAEGMVMRTRVFHAAEKERREVSMEGQQQVMILRIDKGISWMLMPDSRQYMEMPIEVGLETSGDFAGYDIQRTSTGKEKVNGLNTTKYKVVMNSPEGLRLEGFMWISDHGIVVKMDASSTGAESGGAMRMELSNIRITKQDPKLFEIPAGFSKFNMGTFSGVPERP